MPKLDNVCIECERPALKLFIDVREPPLAEGECICRSCALGALRERIEEMEMELNLLKDTEKLMSSKEFGA